MMRSIATIALALCLCSCAGTQRRALTVGHTVVTWQMMGQVSPTGRAMAIALTPFALGSLAVYRAAGGRDHFPSAF